MPNTTLTQVSGIKSLSKHWPWCSPISTLNACLCHNFGSPTECFRHFSLQVKTSRFLSKAWDTLRYRQLSIESHVPDLHHWKKRLKNSDLKKTSPYISPSPLSFTFIIILCLLYINLNLTSDLHCLQRTTLTRERQVKETRWPYLNSKLSPSTLITIRI